MPAEIKNIIDRLKSGMLGYIEDDDQAPYTKADVEKCLQLIDKYLNSIGNSPNKEKGMKVVEETVLALNELNEKCEGSLIETDQREDICEIIIVAGYNKGYNELSNDITEEWREW